MRLVTRGLGGGQFSGLVLQGMTLEVVRIIRAGGRIARDTYKNFIEEFTIAAKLLEINGKEMILPIFNKRTYTIDESVQREVRIKNINLKKKKKNNASVFAKILKISRGSDE